MSVHCTFCGGDFDGGGIGVIGLGTFCSQKCKQMQIHQNAGLFQELRYFKCPNCQTVMTTPFRGDREKGYWCRCWRKMVFQFSVPVDTDERRELAARGQVWNPHKPKLESWVCVRCGIQFTDLDPSVLRADGRSCLACYRAEEHPPIQLRTPEEIEARRLEREAFRRDMEDRHERAIQQTEQEQQ